MATEPNLTEIAATSLRKRSGKIADNIGNNNAFLFMLNKAGGIEKGVTGQVLLEEHDFDENVNVKRYSGGEALSVMQSAVLSAFQYDWKQMSVAVIMNGLEEVQNGGIHQSIKLLTARMKNAERSIKNIVNADIRSDGTASGGKQIGGLALLVAQDPTTGTVGGVNRATYSYARNYKFDTSVEGSGAASVATIERYLRDVRIATHRDGDTNRLGFLGDTFYALLAESTSSRQRFVDAKMADLGFENMMVDGVRYVLGGGFVSAGSDATAMTGALGYVLNMDYFKLQVGKGRFFQPLSPRESQNQDASVNFLLFCGNLTCCNFGLQAVIFD